MLAYLDPASGSMILSVIAGGIAGIAVFFKSFGHRIWSFLAFWKDDEVEVGDDETPDEDAGGGSAVDVETPVETSS